jgi:hypothetical protein
MYAWLLVHIRILSALQNITSKYYKFDIKPKNYNLLGSSQRMDATPPSQHIACNSWGTLNPPCLLWFGSHGRLWNVKPLLGWIFNIEFGWRIGLKGEGGQIAEGVNSAIMCKNPPPTFFLNVDSQSMFGLKWSNDLIFKTSTFLVGMQGEPSSNGGRRQFTNKGRQKSPWRLLHVDFLGDLEVEEHTCLPEHLHYLKLRCHQNQEGSCFVEPSRC